VLFLRRKATQAVFAEGNQLLSPVDTGFECFFQFPLLSEIKNSVAMSPLGGRFKNLSFMTAVRKNRKAPILSGLSHR
jgi:hypothetical protein